MSFGRGDFLQRTIVLYGPNLVNVAPADYNGAPTGKVGGFEGWYAFRKVFD
jgi:hypothetical protein